jgi:5,10-methylenetetrahydromethanopterin reductase
MMRCGVVLQGVDAPDEFVRRLGSIETLGYDIVWLTDSSLHARNCWAYLTLAAAHTSSLLLGTAVTNPVTRHPGITAAAAATVDEISGGRLVLGYGAGDRPLHALDVEPASLGTMRAAIGATRELLAGQAVTADDDRFRFRDAHLRFAARADIPIYLAASGEKTLRAAGEIADGVILLCGLFDGAVRWAIDQIEEGAGRAGRPRPHVAVFAYGRVCDDGDAALETARTIAAWFPQTAPVYCELAGLDPEVVAAVRARYEGGEFQEAQQAGQLLPEDFVRRMALAGDVEATAEQLAALAAIGVDSVHVFPLGEDRVGTIERFAAAADAGFRS